MKRIISLLLGCFLSSILLSQNVGIGVPFPAEKLHVDSGNIKIGSSTWSSTANDRFIKFGDGEYVRIGETGSDDWMQLQARKFTFTSYSAVNIPLVEINGNVKIIDGNQGANKVLTSDASGLASWKPAANPSTASFRATKTANQISFSGSSNTMNFGSTDYNDGSNFSSDQFVVPTTGVYHFDIKLMWILTAIGAVKYSLIVSLNSGFSATELSRSQYIVDGSVSGNMTTDLSLDIKLTAGQNVYVMSYQNSGANQSVLSLFSAFSGHRLY